MSWSQSGIWASDRELRTHRVGIVRGEGSGCRVEVSV